MCLLVNTSIWILVLISLTTAHPSCSSIYGRPNGDDCLRIVASIGLHDVHNPARIFVPYGSDPPPNVGSIVWSGRVLIPYFWYLAQFPRCRVALLPTLNSTHQSLSSDVSRFLSIQSVSLGINHYCVQALNMPGISGTGGIDSAGNNNNLRVILYAPLSKFENDTMAAKKQNKPIAISYDSTDDEYEPAPPDSPPRKRTKFGGGGMGLMRSMGGGSTVRNLGDGWYMSYDSTTSILPTQIGAANLESFYTQVVKAAAHQISTVVDATQNLAFRFNGLTLRLASEAPISWTWVLNFAADMGRYAGDSFAVLYSGEAYSYYWDIVAVSASLSYL